MLCVSLCACTLFIKERLEMPADRSRLSGLYSELPQQTRRDCFPKKSIFIHADRFLKGQLRPGAARSNPTVEQSGSGPEPSSALLPAIGLCPCCRHTTQYEVLHTDKHGLAIKNIHATQHDRCKNYYTQHKY